MPLHSSLGDRARLCLKKKRTRAGASEDEVGGEVRETFLKEGRGQGEMGAGRKVAGRA